MAKSTKRKALQGNKARRRTAAYLSGGGQSKYAKRHKGGGNTRPQGMWLAWRPEGNPGAVTQADLDAITRQREENRYGRARITPTADFY